MVLFQQAEPAAFINSLFLFFICNMVSPLATVIPFFVKVAINLVFYIQFFPHYFIDNFFHYFTGGGSTEPEPPTPPDEPIV